MLMLMYCLTLETPPVLPPHWPSHTFLSLIFILPSMQMTPFPRFSSYTHGLVSHLTIEWCQHPLQRYRQLWTQLLIVDGVLHHKYIQSPMSEPASVPILHNQALDHNHNVPSAGGSKVHPRHCMGNLGDEAY